jgi:hypothetical protein
MNNSKTSSKTKSSKTKSSINNKKTEKSQTKLNTKLFNRTRFRKYDNTKKVLKTLSNIKKFKNFYKNISKIDKETLQLYKGTVHKILNSYLYNHNNLKELKIDEFSFGNTIKNLYSNNTKQLFNYKNINLEKLPNYIELYINKFIVNKINILDKLFTNKEIPKFNGNELLFRGTKGETNTSIKSKVGDEIIYNSFTSTSTDKEVSRDFISSKSNSNHVLCCLYILYGLKDVPYIYLPWSIIKNKEMKGHISESVYDEFEYLLPRNLKFKIKKIDKIVDDTLLSSSSSSITFEKLNKLMKKTKNSDLYKKFYGKIKVYHLDFIEQLPVEPLPAYIYNPKIHLQFEKSFENVNYNSKKNIS